MNIGGIPIIDTGTMPEAHPRTILVVEDEVMLRMLICDVLRDDGFEVVEAGSGDEALNFLATGVQVDALFTDIRMPGTLDGIGLAERVAAGYPGLPVMLTSGDHGRQAMATPFRFFAKPYNPFHVSAVIAETLSKSLSANRGEDANGQQFDDDLPSDR